MASSRTSASSSTIAYQGEHERRKATTCSAASSVHESAIACAIHAHGRAVSWRLTSKRKPLTPIPSALTWSPPEFGVRCASKPWRRRIATTSRSPRAPLSRLARLMLHRLGPRDQRRLALGAAAPPRLPLVLPERAPAVLTGALDELLGRLIHHGRR